MIYYFFSEKQGLKGFINHRLVKDILCDRKEKAVEYALKNNPGLKEKPVGYIYSCRQVSGEYLNGAYKTQHPVQITGCEKLEDLL